VPPLALPSGPADPSPSTPPLTPPSAPPPALPPTVPPLAAAELARLALSSDHATISLGAAAASALELSRTAAGTLHVNRAVEVAGDINFASGSLAALLASLQDKVAALEARAPELPAGAIAPFATPTAPAGWLECNGSEVARAAFPALYAAIGEAWGAGDGTSTFALPDLRGAFLRGSGTHGSAASATGDAFAGPALGAFQSDQLQGHAHTSAAAFLGVYPTGGGDSSNGGAAFTQVTVGGPIGDGAHGEPRVGGETRPFAAGVRFCVRAQ
jgi:hypothetical protein